MKRKPRLLAIVVAAAALGGLAAGIVVGRGGSSQALAQGPPGVLAQGKFRPVGWSTSGTATIVRDSSGHLRLRFSGSFRTQPAPELFVYLARYEGRHRTAWIEVAPLRSPSGAQEYDLSAEAARQLRGSVAIYCAKCNRNFGIAQLQPTRSAS